MTRVLTGTQRREVEAQLEKLVGEIVIVKIKRRRFELKLNTLSEEDQEFLRKWAEEEE